MRSVDEASQGIKFLKLRQFLNFSLDSDVSNTCAANARGLRGGISIRENMVCQNMNVPCSKMVLQNLEALVIRML